jgi:hypothetical protein
VAEPVKERYPDRLYVPAALAAALVVSIGAAVAIAQGRGLYMTSGVWAGLAYDLAHGEFYRPVHAPDGFGGTRYMPFHFLLHGGLMSIINMPAVSAFTVVLGAGFALAVGIYRLARALDVPPKLAGPAAIMPFVTLNVAYGLTSTRGDLLAAALNVWGLVFAALAMRQFATWRVSVAGLFFALAFLTKFTTVFGAAAVVFVALANRRYGFAAAVSATTSAFAASGLVLIHVASQGRALDAFLACAAGGTGLVGVLFSPLSFLYAARIDVPFCAFFLLGLIALVLRRRTAVRELLPVAFVFTMAVTVFIMSSPGTDLSHYIDVTVMAVVLATWHVSRGAESRVIAWGLPVTTMAGALAIAIASVTVFLFAGESRWRQQAAIMEVVGEGPAPILADDPWVPILAGERPFVLDNFAIHTVSKERPEVAQDLFDKIDRQFFRAAVLYLPRQMREHESATNGTWRGQWWYDDLLYPPGFHERLLAAYEPKLYVGEYIALLPRSGDVQRNNQHESDRDQTANGGDEKRVPGDVAEP